MNFRAKTQFVVQQDLIIEISGIELLAEVGNDRDGKLQSLALVYGHEPDGVFSASRWRFRARSGRFFRVDEAQELIKALTMELVKLPRTDQFLDVRQPLCRSCLRGEPV